MTLIKMDYTCTQVANLIYLAMTKKDFIMVDSMVMEFTK